MIMKIHHCNRLNTDSVQSNKSLRVLISHPIGLLSNEWIKKARARRTTRGTDKSFLKSCRSDGFAISIMQAYTQKELVGQYKIDRNERTLHFI